jgi:8-oxo-dGTP pyrophosphatase MutT (NUDIX family)
LPLAEVVFSTRFFQIEKLPTANTQDPEPFYRLSGPDGVICCVLDSRGDFWMVEQFRPSQGTLTLEFPAGGIGPSESPSTAARRELREELAITCDLLQLGQSHRLMMDRTSIRNYLFFGMDPRQIEGIAPEPGLVTRKVSRGELLASSLSGDYLQLAGLGILALAGGLLGVDMWRDSLGVIQDKFVKAHQGPYGT